MITADLNNKNNDGDKHLAREGHLVVRMMHARYRDETPFYSSLFTLPHAI